MNFVELIQALPLLRTQLSLSVGERTLQQCYREAGSLQSTPVPLVLLHGIGSGSASWVCQLEAAQSQQRAHVVAWDAPGYAYSSPVCSVEPLAHEYGQRLWDWLDALGMTQVHLVGHSLGCIMAASAARLQPHRVTALTLLAPALGYGSASEVVRNQKRSDRLQALAAHGAEKMAQLRGPALLSPHAPPEQVALAVHMMSQIQTAGYIQATHLLAQADITADLHAVRSASRLPITVACGELDNITSAPACRALAQAVGAHYVALGDAGHLCALEASAAVNSLLGLTQVRV
jgi:pimeloyl-ACP methyl ester carboxylesterase